MIRQCINACPPAHVQVDFLVDNLTFLVFHINKRPMLIRQQNLRLVQIGWNPLLFCLLVRYLAHIMWHDVTLPNCISCIIEHVMNSDLAEKPPSFLPFGELLGLYHVTWCNFAKLYSMHHWSCHEQWLGRKSPPISKNCDWIYCISCNFQQLWFSWQKSPPPPGKILRLDLSISCNFQQLWFSWQKSLLPPKRKKFWDWIYPFHAISSNFGSVGRKVPPPFLPFHERPSLCCTWRIPMVPILQIHTQIPPIWISSIGYQLCQLFKILTYTEVQDTGSWCRWKAYRQPYHNTH